MQRLLNSEREVITFAAEVGLLTFFPRVGPEHNPGPTARQGTTTRLPTRSGSARGKSGKG
jgi:hypothetical protein